MSGELVQVTGVDPKRSAGHSLYLLSVPVTAYTLLGTTESTGTVLPYGVGSPFSYAALVYLRHGCFQVDRRI